MELLELEELPPEEEMAEAEKAAPTTSTTSTAPTPEPAAKVTPLAPAKPKSKPRKWRVIWIVTSHFDFLTTVRADKCAHILDDSQDGRLHLLEQLLVDEGTLREELAVLHEVDHVGAGDLLRVEGGEAEERLG